MESSRLSALDRKPFHMKINRMDVGIHNLLRVSTVQFLLAETECHASGV
jgi:hypothetical protein